MKNKDIVCIIIAAGDGTRWNNYLGRPKHFIEIDGEPIIARTVRLAAQYSSKIYIVGNSPDFQINGATWFRPQLNPRNHDADKFFSSASLWNQEGRTVVIYGDVYFTEEAMQRIMEFQPRQWALFARFRGSKVTGKRYQECFAHAFYPEHIAEHTSALQKIMEAYSRKQIKRCGGWEHYRAMEGFALKWHHRKNRFVEIDDWTEDFDYPADYDRWFALRYKRGWLFELYTEIRRFLHAKKRRRAAT